MGINREEKPWPCPKCGHNLGYVVYGQLLLKGDNIHANTDGGNLVVYCSECGARKTWFANDRLSRLIGELADQIVRRTRGS